MFLHCSLLPHFPLQSSTQLMDRPGGLELDSHHLTSAGTDYVPADIERAVCARAAITDERDSSRTSRAWVEHEYAFLARYAENQFYNRPQRTSSRSGFCMSCKSYHSRSKAYPIKPCRRALLTASDFECTWSLS